MSLTYNQLKNALCRIADERDIAILLLDEERERARCLSRQLYEQERRENVKTKAPESQVVPIFQVECTCLPEVGDPVEIELPDGAVTATWLGTVSSGKDLARAMRLMWAIAVEGENE